MADINDLIAGGIRPPQVEDMTTASARALTLGNAMQARQLQGQQMQMGQLELQDKQRQMAQTQALNAAYSSALSVDPDGKPTVDRGRLTHAISSSGYGSALPGVLKQLDEMDKTHADLTKLRGEIADQETLHAGELGATVRAAEYDPRLMLTLGALQVKQGHVNPQQIGPLLDPIAQALEQDPTGASAKSMTRQLADRLIAGSPKQRELDSAAETADARKRTADTGAAKLVDEKDLRWLNAAAAAGSQQELDQLRSRAMKDGISSAAIARTPPMYSQAAMQTFGRSLMSQEQRTQADERVKEADERAKENARPKTPAELATVAADPTRTPADRAAADAALKRLDQYQQAGKTTINLGASGVNDDDFKRAGEQYARTGAMPSLGQGSAPARQRILHEANEFARAQGLRPSDVITMQAAYNGDRKSLATFQSQRDQIVSFEQTAQKNLDQFLGLAAKIPDTGSPWVNTPLRLVDQKLAGDANMAAVNAARAVATNEIAKVTSGGGLSGVLSDAARQEVKEYNPANATFAQTLAVAKVLKQDMANRHASMDSTLADIKARIGGGSEPGSPAAAPKATHRFNSQTGQIEPIQK